jgi:phospholipid-binding lipoprotein MlaA
LTGRIAADRAVRCTLLVLCVVATSLGAGCATNPPSRVICDRFAPVNSIAYRFDRMLDTRLIEPIARAYARGDADRLPGKTRRRVGNFFAHLLGPIDITNNFLQGKPVRGFSGIGRLLVNSTVGLAGLFDPASRWGMPRHSEDFGQTLATWGIPHGPYVYVPVFGPRSVRDLFGLAADLRLSPVIQADDTATRNALFIAAVIDRRTDQFVLDVLRPLQDQPYIWDRENYEGRRYEDTWYDGAGGLNLDIYSTAEGASTCAH